MVACSVDIDESNNFGVVIGTALINNIASFSFYIKLRNKRKFQGKQGGQTISALYMHILKRTRQGLYISMAMFIF